MLVPVKYIMLETISVTNVFAAIHRIAELCADSKRKRLPALYRLLIPQ
jgi:Na+-translocating ferredoxin:NAD+ oxidoreductase RnfA subunit